MSGPIQHQVKTQKVCTVCGTEVSGQKRVKDPKGRYFCEPCWAKTLTDQNHEQTQPVGLVARTDPESRELPFCEGCGGRFEESTLALSNDGQVLCKRCVLKHRRCAFADKIRFAQTWVPHTIIAAIILGPFVIPAQVWLALRLSQGLSRMARGFWVALSCMPWLGVIGPALLSRQASNILGPSPATTSSHGKLSPHILEIAICQRKLMWAVALGILALALFPLLIVAIPLQTWRTYRLANAMGFNAILWSIAVFVPYVGVAILLILNSQATAVLKDAGIRVGLMGAILDE